MSKGVLSNIDPDDTIYFVRQINRRQYGFNEGYFQVLSVGRKWIKAQRVYEDGRLSPSICKFDIATGAMDGGAYSSPGRAYPSKEDVESLQETKALYKRLKEHFNSYSLPTWANNDKLKRIFDIIRE